MALKKNRGYIDAQSIGKKFDKRPAVVWEYIGISIFVRKYSKVAKAFEYKTIV